MKMRNALMEFAGQLDKKREMDNYNAMMSASPQFAQQYYSGLRANAGQDLQEKQFGLRQNQDARAQAAQQRELDKQQALRDFAGRIGGTPVTPETTGGLGGGGVTGINPNAQRSLDTALAEYAQITGDPSKLLDYQIKQQSAGDISQSGGATGAMVQQIIEEDNGINNTVEALELLRGGAGATGRLTAEQELGRAAEFEKKTGALEAELGLQPQIAADTATAEKEAVFNLEGQQSLVKQQRDMEDTADQNEFINTKSEEIKGRINNMTAGWKGSIASSIKGTEAFDVYSDIQTVVANSALDTLIKLKAEGGTLGALSEKELELLMAKKANLDNSQSPEQLRKNLDSFVAQNNKALAKLERRYAEDSKRFGGADDNGLPTPATPSPQAPAPAASNVKKWGDDW